MVKTMKVISDKVISRLTKYKSLLSEQFPQDKKYVFSHELATMMRVTPSQVRRDLMVLGYQGVPRYGYEVDELVKHIGQILESDVMQNIALIGVGNLGKALMTFLEGRRSNLKIVAAFDADKTKTDRLMNGIACYNMDRLDEIINQLGINVAIVCVPGGAAQMVADRLVHAGVRGILNFAPIPLRVPLGVYLEEIDVTSTLEKVAYFSTLNLKGEKGTNEKC
jgi:redox-sensing transcriptional repressor